MKREDPHVHVWVFSRFLEMKVDYDDECCRLPVEIVEGLVKKSSCADVIMKKTNQDKLFRKGGIYANLYTYNY